MRPPIDLPPRTTRRAPSESRARAPPPPAPSLEHVRRVGRAPPRVGVREVVEDDAAPRGGQGLGHAQQERRRARSPPAPWPEHDHGPAGAVHADALTATSATGIRISLPLGHRARA